MFSWHKSRTSSINYIEHAQPFMGKSETHARVTEWELNFGLGVERSIELGSKYRQ